ncbi:MAG: FMN-binding protein [Candidatus Sericytochromatia bacterium]|nr:FMN-binding protein [Candidatus Sericytochromatia bacterium]
MNKFKKIFLAISLSTCIFLPLIASNALADEEKGEYYEQVYLTEKQALTMVFDTLKVEKKEIILNPEQKKIIQKRLKRKIKENSFFIYTGKKNNKVEKYAFILDEQGKHFPMTFIVSLNNKASVEQVAIMVYREKRGDGVKTKRFLNQFKNKNGKDAIEIDRDIVHITGATISSWSMTSGVKKAVVLTEELVLK